MFWRKKLSLAFLKCLCIAFLMFLHHICSMTRWTVEPQIWDIFINCNCLCTALKNRCRGLHLLTKMCLKALHLFLGVQQLLDNSFCMSYADAQWWTLRFSHFIFCRLGYDLLHFFCALMSNVANWVAPKALIVAQFLSWNSSPFMCN